jgi:hypothetical protein
MPEFRFGETELFKANWEAFLTEMDGIDANMAGILRDNKDKLAAILRQGHRNTHARADFNASVMAALDGVLTPEAEETQN